MRSRWVFQNLSHHLPSWASFLTSAFKPLTSTNPSSTLVLNHVDISRRLVICGREGNLHLGSSLHATILKKFEFHDLDDPISFRNAVVVWNSLLAMYLKSGELWDAGLVEGKQIHGLAWKLGIHSDLCIESALMDMYSKCGSMKDAMEVFEAAEVIDEVSMTVVLVGFAQNGFEEEAIHFFVKMVKGAIRIDANVVSAVLGVFGVDTSLALGKQIHTLAIKKGFESNPFALLGACGIHGDSEVGKYAADQLFLASPNSPAAYILMANIYSSRGKWKERARTIKRMKQMGLAKETGISWIEIDREVHSFVVGDQMHPQRDLIRSVLVDLLRHMRDEGYEPDKRFILYYLNQDEEAID
ncbi:tetratricopeptide repeat (TPR)-like superfamily protein [Actinidia rufa]|uniref:Tetratricopeptide repeat (TPR)-like superfamily protein n=1 Tax=Actinidia rufa TaxID=165716 RepID=A0A7J0EZU2_9ERIC|nr:tetratricopeptide repeat (TPR)-like superfamily protein [Actinidia rufa]